MWSYLFTFIILWIPFSLTYTSLAQVPSTSSFLDRSLNAHPLDFHSKLDNMLWRMEVVPHRGMVRHHVRSLLLYFKRNVKFLLLYQNIAAAIHSRMFNYGKVISTFFFITVKFLFTKQCIFTHMWLFKLSLKVVIMSTVSCLVYIFIHSAKCCSNTHSPLILWSFRNLALCFILLCAKYIHSYLLTETMLGNKWAECAGLH